MHVLNPHNDSHERMPVFIPIMQMRKGNPERLITCVSGITRLCRRAIWLQGPQSSFTLNVNGLNTPIKRHRVADRFQKKNPYICCLQETHFKSKDTLRLKVRAWKKVFHANGNKKKAEVSILNIRQINFTILPPSPCASWTWSELLLSDFHLIASSSFLFLSYLSSSLHVSLLI